MGLGAQSYLRAVDAVARNSQGVEMKKKETKVLYAATKPLPNRWQAGRGRRRSCASWRELLKETGLTEIEIEHNGALHPRRAVAVAWQRRAGSCRWPAGASRCLRLPPRRRIRRSASPARCLRPWSAPSICRPNPASRAFIKRRQDRQGRRHALHRRSDEDHQRRSPRRKGGTRDGNSASPTASRSSSARPS